MNSVWYIFRLVLKEQKTAILRGAALSLVVLLAGIALLSLSGWFITAAAAAGLIGLGAVFDVFSPAAMVRFLALGRTAARYGERLLSHDATLRALTTLRIKLLTATANAAHDQLMRLRAPQALNRLMADVDALDGIILRLILPLGAGLLAQLITFGVLWWLVDLSLALWMILGFLIGSTTTLLWAAHAATKKSAREEATAQSFRAHIIDLMRARSDLTVYGQLRRQGDSALTIDEERQHHRSDLDRIERQSGFALSLMGTVISAGALAIGVALVQTGNLTPALAAIGFFASLALMETVAPLRRAMAELGRMSVAAERVQRNFGTSSATAPMTEHSETADLRIKSLCFARIDAKRPIFSDFSMTINPGEQIALTGASGAGKSTLLLLIARLLTPTSGDILIGSLPLSKWAESELRARVTLVPQRSILMSGSIRAALQLAKPGASDEDLWQVLEAVSLARVIKAKGGLDFTLGAMGSGLSGGETRRLVLARALLRQPQLLLLDEPTEGLDADLALRVLVGIRSYLPSAAILMASHRAVETNWADRSISLNKGAAMGRER